MDYLSASCFTKEFQLLPKSDVITALFRDTATPKGLRSLTSRLQRFWVDQKHSRNLGKRLETATLSILTEPQKMKLSTQILSPYSKMTLNHSQMRFSKVKS